MAAGVTSRLWEIGDIVDVLAGMHQLPRCRARSTFQRLKPRCCPKEPARYIPRSIYEGARDMARQIASSWEGRTARRLRKKVEMLFAHLKRILRLDRLRLTEWCAMSSFSQQPPKTSES
jgi:hypothetical protein